MHTMSYIDLPISAVAEFHIESFVPSRCSFEARFYQSQLHGYDDLKSTTAFYRRPVVVKIILLFVFFAISGIVVETIGARPKRAAGGESIPIHQAPHFVSLRRKLIHVCGGALISTKHVLTAARCVLGESRKPLYETRVVSGVREYNQMDIGQEIKNIYPHEGFLNGNQSCDIAVITLSAKVDRDLGRNPIALPVVDLPEKKGGTFTGYQLRSSKHSNPGLHELPVTIRHIHRNTTGHGYVFFGDIGSYRTFNVYDIGGPLVHKRRIVGIASVIKSGVLHTSSFINVFKFKTFIENIIANETLPNLQHSSGHQWPAKRRRVNSGT